MFINFNLPVFEFEKPEPSLCDTCKYAYNLNGSVGIGYISYIQRYCDKIVTAIHTFGYNECFHYEIKNT